MKKSNELIDDVFADIINRPEGPQPKRKVAIISTPRCGSSFFCLSLANTGKFGYPMEWMGTDWIAGYARRFGINKVDLRKYIRFIQSRTTSSNGLFSMNIHTHHHSHWLEQNLDILSLNFDKIYYISRKDKLAQALSLAKARKSGIWVSSQLQSEKEKMNYESLKVKGSDILKALHEIRLWEEYFVTSLAAHTHMHFHYEDFSKSDEIFRDVFTDNDLSLDETSSFNSRIEVQRKASDQVEIKDLINYMGL